MVAMLGISVCDLFQFYHCWSEITYFKFIACLEDVFLGRGLTRFNDVQLSL